MGGKIAFTIAGIESPIRRKHKINFGHMDELEILRTQGLIVVK